MMNQQNCLQENDSLFWEPTYLWNPEGSSKAEKFNSLPLQKKLAFWNSLSDAERKSLAYHWNFWARPKQLPPPNGILPHQLGWKYWVILAGRGFGKSKLAAEYVRHRIENGLSQRIALIAPTYSDVVKTMIKGESGLMAAFTNSKIKLRFVKQDNTIYFTKNGQQIAEAFVYTGEEPERLRGPQHDFAWVDEVAAFKYLEEVWNLFVPGLRLGESKAIFTTTPKAKLLKISLLHEDRTVVTFGESSENKRNLSEGFMESIEFVYAGSDLGDQELKGKLRLDESGSLFRQAWINRNRELNKPEFIDACIAIDPSGSSKNEACECGIIAAGKSKDNKGYVIEDLSKRDTPENWAQIAIMAAEKYHCSIVYEANYGAEMIPTIIKLICKNLNKPVPRLIPVNAAKDKALRAQPISALTQKGQIKFLGTFHKLEQQLNTWIPGGSDKSPDRLDAFVWAMTHLLIKPEPVRGIVTKPVMNF